ncbi:MULTISPECIES: nuclear transport factor 2 family protein [unclassified Leptolyngbya]|uniref:nuclear transport factor 2 family protein n=1 Tax=unclassified Leptolyngbya TaxID=2650499 RepID=UPI0016871343|nr:MULTISPECIES: nuclear transport factor 2 family protein [unclassified Leptolyngbya]MBD1913219.1 nuclear transport factor 2 family protein [Leptolyngbya sp. FACHB-8]MBD2153391.1 nuclear transport factor 2 family protein [Leptolyngbya sp. FACHB-16]
MTISQVTGHNAQLDIARRFHAALVTRDWSAIHALLTDDAQWTLPGNNTISGTANGSDAVVDRARKIADYGLKFELLHILVSRNNVALSLHNTAQQDERILDEHLATVCQLKKGKIAAIETFLSDVDGMNAFFV